MGYKGINAKHINKLQENWNKKFNNINSVNPLEKKQNSELDIHTLGNDIYNAEIELDKVKDDNNIIEEVKNKEEENNYIEKIINDQKEISNNEKNYDDNSIIKIFEGDEDSKKNTNETME